MVLILLQIHTSHKDMGTNYEKFLMRQVNNSEREERKKLREKKKEQCENNNDYKHFTRKAIDEEGMYLVCCAPCAQKIQRLALPKSVDRVAQPECTFVVHTQTTQSTYWAHFI